MRYLPKLILGSMLLSGMVLAPAQAADASFTFTMLAGTSGAVNSADGNGSVAQFSAPRGIAVDSTGTILYVADSSNHTIRRVAITGATGDVTTLAGMPGTTGNVDVSPARFSEPFGVAVGSDGSIYIADTNNNAIRKITAAGVVTTLAGGKGPGNADGNGAAAKFWEPHAVALDTSDNIYVTDYMNHTIRKVTPTGVVTTLAGSPGTAGIVNGQGAAARFSALQGIAVHRSTGDIYVAESGNRAIRKITSAGQVTTLANGSDGQFGSPRGVAVDTAGNVYVTDFNANTIKKVTAAGVITNLAGTAPTAGSADGNAATALFNAPSGVAVDSANNLYVADMTNNTVRKITAGGTVTTLAGLAGRGSSIDGTGTAARFEDPYSIATDSSGNIFVADATDHVIRKITSDGTVSTLAGKAGTFGSTNGSGTAAMFNAPKGIATDSSGNVYVADTGNRVVRKIKANSGEVSTLAGTFDSPNGVAVDRSGNVYVIDSQAATLSRIATDGVVTTLAGSARVNDFVDATGAAARFKVPYDLAIDSAGNIYVSDHGNNRIRKVTATGVVTTLAGSSATGKSDGTGAAATFNYPNGITIDSADNVYVADTDNQLLRKISPTGVVTTIGGNGKVGSIDGVGTAAGFYNPMDLAFDASGNLIVVDRGSKTIRKGSLANSSPNTSADCVFNWAEREYGAYFPPGAKSDTTKSGDSTYYYRYYAGKSNAIAVRLDDNVLLVVLAGTNPMFLGNLSGFLGTAGCK